MGNSATILPFRQKMQVAEIPKNTHRRQISADGIKYYNKQQVQLLRKTVRDQATAALARGNKTAVKEWAVIDILTSSGLRVSEAANLRCSDSRIGYGQSSLFVREGKGGKSRTVQIPEALKRHLNSFIAWKQHHGEPTGPDDYLFVGQRGPWSAQAIQQITKKTLKLLGIYEKGKSVHALRHSYATELYRKTKDLRAIQKQLGHVSIQTTQIYADVHEDEIRRQVKGLWGS